MTSLLLPHLASSLTDSLPSLNLLCHSKTDARFTQDAPKAVWSIPYVSVAFFPCLKQDFIAYRSSKGSSFPDCIFEIHQLRQSGFSRVYSNCCCSCSFKSEMIKLGQSYHKMYSNNILNFQESTTILNARAKKSGNLLNSQRIIYYLVWKIQKYPFPLVVGCQCSCSMCQSSMWFGLSVSFHNCKVKRLNTWHNQTAPALSAGTVEYTDCISVGEGIRPFPNECSDYYIKLHLMVTL